MTRLTPEADIDGVRMPSFQRRRLPALLVLLLVVTGLGLVSTEASAAEAGTTVRVSLHSDGSQIAGAAMGPALSSDGSTVLYVAQIPPEGSTYQWFVRDLVNGRTEQVSVGTDGGTDHPITFGDGWDVDGDGGIVVFAGGSEDLAPFAPGTVTGGGTGLFLRDRSTQTTQRLPILTTDGTQYAQARWPQLSDDGNLVAFSSEAQLSAGDDDSSWDVFVHNIRTGITTILSDPAPGTEDEFPAFSADGSTVAYMAGTPGDSNQHLAVVDVASGSRTLPQWQGAPMQVELPSLSGNGQLVAFVSHDDLDPADTSPGGEAYLFDRSTGQVNLLSTGSSLGVSRVEVSDDGRSALIEGSGLLPGDGQAERLYRRDLLSGQLAAVDVTPAGAPTTYEGGSYVGPRSLSADGATVAFDSAATDLVPGDTNGVSDVFVRTFVPGSLDGVLDGSGAPVRTGTEATPEQPVVLAITPPAGTEGRITAVPQPVAPGDTPAGYSLFGSFDTVLAIDGPAPALAGTFYELTFTVDAALLGGVAPEDVQVFRDGEALADCASADPPCVTARTVAQGGDVAITVRTAGFSRWAVGRLDYELAGPLPPVKAFPATNPVRAGQPASVPFRLGGDRGPDVLAPGSPGIAACTGVHLGPPEPLAAGTWSLAYAAASDSYSLTWSPGATGCRALVLRFRDGSGLTVRFNVR